jgi:polysaccharide biosynthesis protein PslH
MSYESRSRKAVVLAGGALRVPGGVSMRWRAIRDALRRHVPCTFRELGCDRWQACQRSCQLTGGPARTNNLVMAQGRVWFHDRNFCDDYARWLADDLVEAGVSMVVCSGLDTYRYVAALAADGRFTVVFDLHNVESVLHREILDALPSDSAYADHYSEAHTRLVGVAERAAVMAADAVWVCSEPDRALAVEHFGVSPGKVWVVPNAVEFDGSGPPGNAAERVSFTGRIDWFPNIGAGRMLADEIAPLLAERGHHVPVVIAGKMARELLDSPGLPANVRLVSDPARTADLITDSVMAVPLALGGGSRFKILEAIAYGAPVVSTAKGVEGLDLSPGAHYLPAEKPVEFADALESLLVDSRLRASVAGAAWQLARERYSVTALADIMKTHVDIIPRAS